MFRGDEYAFGHALRGFTIIELLVTLAVAAVFVAIAVPSYRATINRNSLATQVNDFLADLNYTRSEAITRGNSVRMCKSADGASCATSGGWQQGWIIFDNLDDDNTPTTAELVRVTDGLTNSTKIVGNGTLANAAEFDANGFSIGFAGTVAFCDEQDKNATNIVISTSGRIRSEPASDCVP